MLVSNASITKIADEKSRQKYPKNETERVSKRLNFLPNLTTILPVTIKEIQNTEGNLSEQLEELYAFQGSLRHCNNGKTPKMPAST